jgi:DNA primase
MSDPIQEIKAKLSVEDVVAPYVQLKKSGKYLKACCPFHAEKTPSFYVSVERQLAYCFSCHKGGDMFQFIQDIEGVEFRGALEILAEKAHVDLPKGGGDQPKISKDEKERLKSASYDASKFFVQRLWETGDGEKVLQYLKTRGMTDETLKTFQVGFAPDGKDTLYRFLLEKKHEKADLLASTLVLARDSSSQDVVDRFRLRLMFPIDSTQGDVIGFGGRALKKGDQPKYLNSAEYVLYHKGEVLFNLSRAKEFIKKDDAVVFVEGYFDVMASWQAGVQNVVATSGTALTAEQLKLVKRFTKRVVFAFDSDNAGQEALVRAVLTAQPLDLEIFVVSIPQGKDAADAVKENPQLWIDAVTARVPYLDFFLDQWQKKYDLKSSTGKREFTDAILELLKAVTHPVEQDETLKKLSKLVGTPMDMLYDYLKQLKVERKARTVKQEKPHEEAFNRSEKLVLYFIGMLLAYPAVFFDLWKNVPTFEVFYQRAVKQDLIKPYFRLDDSGYQLFCRDLPNLLGQLAVSFPATSVYKQVEDHYNRAGVVDDSFYGAQELGPKLKKMAFEAEVENPDQRSVQEEMEKVLTLLYFETLTL